MASRAVVHVSSSGAHARSRFGRTLGAVASAVTGASFSARCARAEDEARPPQRAEGMDPEALRRNGSVQRVARGNRQCVTVGHGDYIKEMQIWGVGIKDDPIPGEKRGKGVQHLRSSQWLYDLACFVQNENRAICTMLRYAQEVSADIEGYDFRYFINCSEGLFHRALHEGLCTDSARELLLMSSWCLMAAAEVDVTPFYDRNNDRHSKEWRNDMRALFYKRYLQPEVGFVVDKEDLELERTLGGFGLHSCRFDLIPPVALERLDIHNELCGVKWEKDPDAWMRLGFPISSRVDSMHRHYWSIHARDWSEDHIAHGIWNLMALYHVLVVFPKMNDLTNFSEIQGMSKGMQAISPAACAAAHSPRPLHAE